MPCSAGVVRNAHDGSAGPTYGQPKLMLTETVAMARSCPLANAFGRGFRHDRDQWSKR